MRECVEQSSPTGITADGGQAVAKRRDAIAHTSQRGPRQSLIALLTRNGTEIREEERDAGGAAIEVRSNRDKRPVGFAGLSECYPGGRAAVLIREPLQAVAHSTRGFDPEASVGTIGPGGLSRQFRWRRAIVSRCRGERCADEPKLA